MAKGGCLGRGVSPDKGSEIRQHFIPLETESNLSGGQRVRVGGHEGERVRQMSRAQITHCQEGVYFALSRRGNRAWDEASETREGAKNSQLSWCPPPPRLHIAVLTLGRLLPLSGSQFFHLCTLRSTVLNKIFLPSSGAASSPSLEKLFHIIQLAPAPWESGSHPASTQLLVVRSCAGSSLATL